MGEIQLQSFIHGMNTSKERGGKHAKREDVRVG